MAPAPKPPPPVPNVLAGDANEDKPPVPNGVEDESAEKPVPLPNPKPDPPKDPNPAVLLAPNGEVTFVWPSPIFSVDFVEDELKLESVGPDVALPKPPVLLVEADAPKGDFADEAKAERPDEANADLDVSSSALSLALAAVWFVVGPVEPNGEREEAFAKPERGRIDSDGAETSVVCLSLGRFFSGSPYAVRVVEGMVVEAVPGIASFLLPS